MKKVGRLPNGCTLYVENNPADGRTYWSGEIGGMAIVWNTSLIDVGSIFAALTEEYRLIYAEQIAKKNREEELRAVIASIGSETGYE